MQPSRSISWRCDLCDELLADDGYVTVRESEVAEVRRSRAALEEKPIVSAREIGALPSPARWMFRHHGCDPEPDSGDYAFSVREIGTEAQLLAWTSHLMGKEWLSATNWDEVIRGVGEASDSGRSSL